MLEGIIEALDDKVVLILITGDLVEFGVIVF